MQRVRCCRARWPGSGGRSERTIPIPGFKTVKQIEENIAAMDFGPLIAEQMKEIDVLLGC